MVPSPPLPRPALCPMAQGPGTGLTLILIVLVVLRTWVHVRTIA